MPKALLLNPSEPKLIEDDGKWCYNQLITEVGGGMSVQVGKEAPSFVAKAYHEGTAKEIKLSDYRGKWVMLCFYPADFTCV